MAVPYPPYYEVSILSSNIQYDNWLFRDLWVLCQGRCPVYWTLYRLLLLINATELLCQTLLVSDDTAPWLSQGCC